MPTSVISPPQPISQPPLSLKFKRAKKFTEKNETKIETTVKQGAASSSKTKLTKMTSEDRGPSSCDAEYAAPLALKKTTASKNKKE